MKDLNNKKRVNDIEKLKKQMCNAIVELFQKNCSHKRKRVVIKHKNVKLECCELCSKYIVSVIK